MKKYRILLLIIPVGLLIVWILLRMNEVGILYDNTTPAQELVSEVYDSELKDTLVNENGVCRFDTLKELAERFKAECVRAPQEYRQSYKPYAVLLFDDGSRAFVFFDPDSFEEWASRKLDRLEIPSHMSREDVFNALHDDLSEIYDSEKEEAKKILLEKEAEAKEEAE